MEALVFILTLLVFLDATPRYECVKRRSITLEDVLPADYDRIQMPDEEGRPTDVHIQIVLLNIRSVDVAEMSFIADVFLNEEWKDPRLIYPEPNHERIALDPDWRNRIWMPDVYFYNAVEGKLFHTLFPYAYLYLRNDSTLIFGARLSLELSCDMLLHKFPHDTQTCDIIVKSLTHTLTEMNLQWKEEDPIILGDCIILPQFELAAPNRSSCNESNAIEKHRAPQKACLRGIIQLTRRSGYYIINIYIPTVLIVFMAMLTFWIPYDAVPGRVTLGVTSLLTIITKQYQASLPSVSYIIALNVWLSVCIGFVFCSLLEYAAVIALVSHQKRIKSDFSKDASKDLLCGNFCFVNTLLKRLEKIDVIQIDRVSRVAFPVIFCIHCVLYLAFYM